MSWRCTKSRSSDCPELGEARGAAFALDWQRGLARPLERDALLELGAKVQTKARFWDSSCRCRGAYDLDLRRAREAPGPFSSWLVRTRRSQDAMLPLMSRCPHMQALFF